VTDMLSDTISERLEESARSLTAVDQGALRRAVDLLLDAYERGATVYTIGNGGSASSLRFAADLDKFATGDKSGFAAFDLTSSISSLTAWTNDEGRSGVYANMLTPAVKEGDVVVAFSVHGGGRLIGQPGARPPTGPGPGRPHHRLRGRRRWQVQRRLRRGDRRAAGTGPPGDTGQREPARVAVPSRVHLHPARAVGPRQKHR